VSAEPDCGIVADFEASGIALCPVGGADCSVAKAVDSPTNKIAVAYVGTRYITHRLLRRLIKLYTPSLAGYRLNARHDHLSQRALFQQFDDVS
jgi:hypothetical protein